MDVPDKSRIGKPEVKRKHFSWGCWTIILSALVGGVAAFYFVLPSTDMGGLFGLKPPLFAKRAQYLEIVEATKSGKLRPDANGIISLKGQFEGATKESKVFWERRPDGREFFIFPVWYGRGMDLQGFLFTTSPLVPSDYYQAYGYPVITVCHLSVLNVTPQGGAWYWVIRRMD